MSTQGGEAEGEGDGESQADSMLSAKPNVELDLMTPRSPPEPKPGVSYPTNCTPHQAPLSCVFSKRKDIFLYDYSLVIQMRKLISMSY